ncbi:unnamed protein product, partial [Didymodactylos carnosus]
ILAKLQMLFERLPNEIVLLICDKLGSIESLVAFWGINLRYNSLMNEYYTGSLDLSTLNFDVFQRFVQNILPNISANTHTLKLCHSHQQNGILSIVKNPNHFEFMFPNLTSLSLSFTFAIYLYPYHHLFKQVLYLKMSLYDIEQCPVTIMQNIFMSEGQLKICSLHRVGCIQ